MPLSCLAKAARLAVVLFALSGAVKAQSAAEACAGLTALEGAALSWLTLPLPDTPPATRACLGLDPGRGRGDVAARGPARSG